MLVLAVIYCSRLGSSPCMMKGHGQNRDVLPLKPIHDALGSSVAAADSDGIPLFHRLYGRTFFLEKARLLVEKRFKLRHQTL